MGYDFGGNPIAGHQVGTGVYLVRMIVGDVVMSRKILMMK